MLDREIERSFGLGGLANLALPHNAQPEHWIDGDRTRVIGDDILTTWPGTMRVGERFYNVPLFGGAKDRIYIFRFTNDDIRKQSGHGLVAVDWSSSTAGRILAIGENVGGVDGDDIVGKPRITTGSGLDDIDSRGIYSGSGSKTYVFKISANASPDEFDWSNDEGSTFGTTGVAITGGWQTIENGVEVKFLATTGHTINDEFTVVVGNRPSFALEVNRQTPHQYLKFLGGSKKTLIITPWDTVKVDDGKDVREAGILPPHLKPTIRIETIRDADVGDTSNGTLQWVAAEPGVVVAKQTANPAPAVGPTNAVSITIPKRLAVPAANLAYVNRTINIPGGDTGAKYFRMLIYSDYERHEIGRATFELVISDEVALGEGGNFYRIPIQQRIPPQRWTYLTIPWENGAFTGASIGLRKANALSRKMFSGGSGSLKIIIDDLVIDGDAVSGGVGGTLNADSFNAISPDLFSKNYLFCSAWINTTRGMESMPSPVSDPIELRNSAVKLDLSGSWPQINSETPGLPNNSPDGVDAMQIYVSRLDWDQDPRTGSAAFFRLMGVGGIPLTDLRAETTLATETGTATAQGNLEAKSAVNGSPTATWTLTSKVTATDFTVSDGSFSYDDASVDIPYNNGLIRFTIKETGTFVTGQAFAVEATLGEFSDDTLEAIIGDEIELSDLNNPDFNVRAPFYKALIPPCESAVMVGNTVVLANRPAFFVSGGFTWTNGSFIIEPVETFNASTQVVLNAWMEGRQIRREGDSEKYRILKYIVPNGTYSLGALYIGDDFSATTQQLNTPYQGVTGNARGLILADNKNIYWTNVTNDDGVDIETSSLLNTQPVMPADDGVVGLGNSDEFLFVFGSNNTFIFRPNFGALADLPLATFPMFANPSHIEGVGMIAPRSFVSDKGQSFWLGPRAELYHSVAGAIEIHEVSAQLSEFISGWKGIISTQLLRYSFFALDAFGGERYLYIGLIRSSDSVNDLRVPGVTKNRQDPYTISSSSTPFSYSSSDCLNEGSNVVVAGLAAEFNYGLLIDLNRNRIFPGSECRYTCAGVSKASSCTAGGQIGAATFMGDQDGYLNRVLDDRILSWGNFSMFSIWEKGAGGSSTTFQVDTTIGAYTREFQMNSNVTPVGQLNGLICAKVTPSTNAVEYRRVTGNTVDTVTVDSAWTVDPISNDLLYLAPLPFVFHPAEIRSQYPHAIKQIAFDMTEYKSSGTGSEVPDMDSVVTIESFVASGDENQVDYSRVSATNVYDFADVRERQGRLSVINDTLITKASSHRVTVLPPQNRKVHIRGAKFFELVDQQEEGRE